METNLYFCNVKKEQLEAAMKMIEDGRTYLKNQGLDQWQNGYPNKDSILADIQNNKGYFLTDGQHHLAYLCMDFDGEPAYNDIKGNWLTPADAKYMVIHRLAANAEYRDKGLSSTLLHLAEQFCKEKGIKSIRMDTDPDNKIMQHIMKKASFTYCGTIWFAGGDKLAYEKIVDVECL